MSNVKFLAFDSFAPSKFRRMICRKLPTVWLAIILIGLNHSQIVCACCVQGCPVTPTFWPHFVECSSHCCCLAAAAAACTVLSRNSKYLSLPFVRLISLSAGYKRVAWPPASEERIIREFTPQPQTQSPAPGSGGYYPQANAGAAPQPAAAPAQVIKAFPNRVFSANELYIVNM